MANTQRHGRVQQEILKNVSEVIQKKMNDPRIKEITVTEVDLTGDLQDATVYYSTLDDNAESIDRVQKGLDKATGMIQSLVGKRLTTYHTPRLQFKRDQSIETGSRIDQLLAQLKKEQ